MATPVVSLPVPDVVGTAMGRGTLPQLQKSEDKRSNSLSPVTFEMRTTIILYIWDRFREQGPNTYIIQFPVRAIEM